MAQARVEIDPRTDQAGIAIILPDHFGPGELGVQFVRDFQPSNDIVFRESEIKRKPTMEEESASYDAFLQKLPRMSIRQLLGDSTGG